MADPILFREDWGLYPTSDIHYNTTNESFIEIVDLYQQMGVKNCYFPLALVQQHLADIDPFAPDLPFQTKMDIKLECSINPWYYWREIARVPPQSGFKPVPIRANRSNIALWWCFLNHIDIALIQPRQTGKSLNTDELMCWLLYQKLRNTQIFLLTKDSKLRGDNIQRIKDIRQYLPAYLNPHLKSDPDNQIEIKCGQYANHYATAIGRNQETAANSIGRGHTFPISHTDEGPFIPHLGVALAAMLAAGTAAREEAIRCGTPYGNIFTTTAGKRDEPSGKLFWDMLTDSMFWSESLFDCNNQQHLRQVVENNCHNNQCMINATFSYRQLGYDDDWFRKVAANTRGTPDSISRDFLNKWTTGTATSPLSTELNGALRNSVRSPRYVQLFKNNFTLNWYIDKDKIASRMANGKYVMGMDTSSGVGRDNTTIFITDSRTLETIATAAISEINLLKMCKWVVDLMVTYENIILIPERKSSGDTLVDSLLLDLPAVGINPFYRIYNRVVSENMDEEDRNLREYIFDIVRRPDSVPPKIKTYFGFATGASSSAHSRGALYDDTLQLAASFCANSMQDQGTVDEITALVTKNDRIDHGAGKHDDRVIAWLLTNWFLIHTKNLHRYGIKDALSGAIDYYASKAREDQGGVNLEFEQAKNARIKREIDELLDKLRDCKDEFVMSQYEARLRLLDSRFSEEDKGVVSINDLIIEAKETRRKRARTRHREAA